MEPGPGARGLFLVIPLLLLLTSAPADDATREHVLDAVRFSIQQQLDDHRCPAHCRAHERALADLPRLVPTWKKELRDVELDDETTIVRFDAFDGHSMGQRYEIQHRDGESVLLELCYEFACEPRSQRLTSPCWAFIDRALDRAAFWDAKELISKEGARGRYAVHATMFTMEGKRGEVHRRFEFFARDGGEAQPGDRLARDLWQVVETCLRRR